MATNRDSELNKRYGNLFDGFLDKPQARYKTQQELKQETQNRYGHLFDCVRTEDALYDDMMGIEDSCRRMRQEREESNKQADIQMKERIERENREEKRRNDEKNAFVDSIIGRRDAEKRARREAEKKRRLEDEKRQDVIGSLGTMRGIADEASRKASQTREMLARDEQRRKEHDEQMEWYRKQQQRK